MKNSLAKDFKKPIIKKPSPTKNKQRLDLKFLTFLESKPDKATGEGNAVQSVTWLQPTNEAHRAERNINCQTPRFGIQRILWVFCWREISVQSKLLHLE